MTRQSAADSMARLSGAAPRPRQRKPRAATEGDSPPAGADSSVDDQSRELRLRQQEVHPCL